MAGLTAQERACFEPIDRQIPGSNLVGIAESIATRTEEEFKARLAHGLFPPILNRLAEIRDEFSWAGHDHEHEAAAPDVTDECVACRLQRVIDSIMEALL